MEMTIMKSNFKNNLDLDNVAAQKIGGELAKLDIVIPVSEIIEPHFSHLKNNELGRTFVRFLN
jgi:hypothetical protein